jgi:predicted transcriptional regulator
MPSKVYKDYKIYCCFALNRLVGELDIDLYQVDLEEKLDDILKASTTYLTKEDIKHEIRSNHYMTNKVIDQLVEDGFVEVKKVEKSYRITITKKGVLHIRKYNTFYKQIYSDQIKEHYKFRELPHWFIKA